MMSQVQRLPASRRPYRCQNERIVHIRARLLRLGATTAVPATPAKAGNSQRILPNQRAAAGTTMRAGTAL